MDTLLKETVDATVNSRYPGMAPEGRKLIEDILIRKELEKGELLFKEGQVCHHMVFVGKGMMRQFYYKNGKDVTEHFSYEGCVIICIESTLKQEPTRLMAEALEPCTVYASPLRQIHEIDRNLLGNKYVLSQDTGILTHRIPGESRFMAFRDSP